jgi:hypothetical protein
MYCIKCGAELSSTERVCPICNTKVYHPDFIADVSEATYPVKEFKSEEFNRTGLLFVITIIWLLPLFLPLALDLSLNGTPTWSGYSFGGLVLAYVCMILPFWFKHPNPVIFVPCDFATVILLLWYINLSTGGNWFWSFAFPLTGSIALIIAAMITILKYVRVGKLYTVGGTLIATGAWTMLLEFLIFITFGFKSEVHWSLYTASSFALLGLMLIVIAIIKPLKESLRKIFFIN